MEFSTINNNDFIVYAKDSTLNKKKQTENFFNGLTTYLNLMLMKALANILTEVGNLKSNQAPNSVSPTGDS
jgi:hypothetical protein